MSQLPFEARIGEIKWSGPSFSGGTMVIARTVDGRGVKGEMHDPRVGENYRFWGQWVDSKFGPTFAFTSYEILVDQSASGVEQYLRSHVDGLGPVKAKALVAHFGDETLATLRAEPDRSMEVAGITPAIAKAIRHHFEKAAEHDPVAESRLIELFRDAKFPKSLVKKLMKAYRTEAPRRVLENPYLLMDFRGVGWKTVDAFACTVAKYARDGIERHKAAVVEAFDQAAQDGGHTCDSWANINAAAASLLGMPARGDSWAALATEGVVVAHAPGPDGSRPVALAKYARAEAEVAERLVKLMVTAPAIDEDLPVDGLAPEQVDAVRMIQENGVAFLTGAPGVGKTYVTAKVIAGLIGSGIPASAVWFVAPTGKAAKRGRELLAEHGLPNVRCSTIHKALMPTPSTEDAGAGSADAKLGRARMDFAFGRGPTNPIPAAVVVCDEASMKGILLARDLVRAIADGTRFLIVGDENQIQSIGAGAFLRDCLAAGMPATTLREIRRSDSAGTVVHACHDIRDGKVPTPADCVDLPGGKNWVHLEVADPQGIADAIVGLHANVKSFDKFWGMQVVTPQKDRHPFATGPLNARLSPMLNPIAARAMAEVDDDGDPSGSFRPDFHVGDKVIRVENAMVDGMFALDRGPDAEDWEDEPEEVEDSRRSAAGGLDDRGEDDEPKEIWWHWRGEHYHVRKVPIVNGDMGIVRDILMVPKAGKTVVVELVNPKRLVRLPFGSAKLDLAYALTCHKMQGSGADYVIIPAHSAVFAGLFTREWFYTALSRTQVLCVTVGQFAAIAGAVARKTVHLRRTRLKELLQAELAELARAEMGEAGESLETAGCELVAVACGEPGDEEDGDDIEYKDED